MKCPHFAEIVLIQAQKYGEKKALWSRDDKTKTWNGLSWIEFANQVKSVARAMFDIGILNQHNIAIYSQNKQESFVVDFAAFAVRAVTVPLYATSTASQVEYIVNDASISTIFVGEQYQYDIAFEVKKTSEYLKRIIIFDNSVVTHGEDFSLYFSDFLQAGIQSTSHFEVENCQHYASEDQLATIMYTSGTTGNPKGVMLFHSNYLEAMRIHDLRLTTVSDKDTSVAFLPITHVFERTWCYFCLYKGVELYVNLRPQEIQQAIKEIRPTLMCAVPRFWEKVYATVQEKLENYSPFMQGVVTWAVAVGRKYNLDYLRIEKEPPLRLKISYKLADKLIFSKVKKTLGLENANFLPVAGAAFSDDIAIFFKSLGVPVLYGYGLTESTATVACFDYTNYQIGTVGKIMPGVEVKIGEDNEILLKGETIFHGYYKRPEINAISFTKDGFFKTGDAGYVENNQIILTERIKDLFKTSNGKYIAPQQIETRLGVDKYIDQVAIIGDQRNFVTAIIAPDTTHLQEYANREKIDFQSIDELLKNPRIITFYEERIKMHQQGMASFEQIKRFTLIKKGFSLETGELTNTLKLRRAVILHKYKAIIDQMYSDK